MRLRFPHPMVLLLATIGLAAALTWILPAGSYERVLDAATGREVVVPGSYATAERSPVGPMGALLAVPLGIVAGADVIVVILFVGGAFALLDGTGALARLVGGLVGRTRSPFMIVAAVSTGFATLGALENMHEEIIALVPVMLVLSRGLGFGAVTALAMSLGSAVVGAAFGPTNPFAAGIALKIAGLSPLSGGGLRLGMLIAALAIWIAWTLSQVGKDDVRPEVTAPSLDPPTRRDALMLALVLLPFGPYVYGVLLLDWGFNELSALFLVAAYAVGLVGGLGLRDTTERYLAGMATMLTGALFVGLARSISVVLTDGRIIDTILYGLATPLEDAPGFLAGGLMVAVQALLHIPVVSNSGQAVLTMPILAPLADLLGFSRQVSVIAYQTGGALSDAWIPTNGAMLAMLVAAQVPYGRWLRFAVPGLLLVAIVGFVAMALAY
ncbi:MAG: Na+/H+ antiporter NhaC family protein [Gemmatimonadota bacterium]